MSLSKRTLGRTGLEVTTLGYGAMELRNAQPGRETTEEQAEKILNAVLDAGINFIDTSIDYGMSEERIGKYISHRRSEYYLASKCGCPLEVAPGAPRPAPHSFTKENIIAGVEQSLRRMKTDYLDLVQFHQSPSKEVLDANGSLEALQQLKDQGKIRFIASSSTLPNIAEHITMGVFDAFQIPYSALQRQHEDIISASAAAGSGTIIRGGAARGAAGKNWSVGPIGVAMDTAESMWEKAALDDLLDGASRQEFILRFTLTHPDLHTTIVGTSNPEHLAANLAAAEKGPLPADVYAEAKRRLDAVAPPA